MPKREYFRNAQNMRECDVEVFDVLSRWFKRLQDGTHVLALPDPFQPMNQEAADKLVEIVDQDWSENEQYRVDSFEYNPITGEKIIIHPFDALPEMSRLCPNARLAMWQELQKIFKYQHEHPEEYYVDKPDNPDYTPEQINMIQQTGILASPSTIEALAEMRDSWHIL